MADNDNEVPRRGPEGDLLSSSERAAMRDDPIKIPDDDVQEQEDDSDEDVSTSQNGGGTDGGQERQDDSDFLEGGGPPDWVTDPGGDNQEEYISRDRAKELLEQERELLQEPGFSQDDAQRQQEIRQELEEGGFEDVDPGQMLGPPTQEIRTGVTVEEQEQGIAEGIRQRNQAKQTQKNIENQVEFLRENPDIQQVQVDGEQLPRSQAIDRLQETEQRAAEVEEELQTQIEQRRQQFEEKQIQEDEQQRQAANQLQGELLRQRAARGSRQPDVETVMETGPVQDFFQTAREFDSAEATVNLGGQIMRRGQQVREGIGTGTTTAITAFGEPGLGTGETPTLQTGRRTETIQPERFQEDEQLDLPEPGLFASGAGFVTGSATGEPIQGVGVLTSGVGGFAEDPRQFAIGSQQPSEVLNLPGNNENVIDLEGSDIARGGGLFLQQFREQPIRTTAEEGIGEISETLIGTAVAGPFGAAAGAIPTVTVEPGPSLVTGDLGTRPGETNIVQVPESQVTESVQRQRIRQAQEFGVSRREEDVTITDEGGITRDVEVVTPEGVIVGRRTETPVTRRQFVRERLPRAEDIELPDISFDLSNRRTGQFAPPRSETTSPDPQAESPETGIEFGEDVTPGELFGQEPVPQLGRRTQIEAAVPTLEELPENRQNQVEQFNQDLGINQVPDQRLPPIQEPDVEITPETRPLVEPTPRIEQTQIFKPVSEPRAEGRPDTTATPTPTPELDIFTQERQESGEAGGGREQQRAPSIDALLLGITEEDPDEDEEFTGFETRGLNI